MFTRTDFLLILFEKTVKISMSYLFKNLYGQLFGPSYIFYLKKMKKLQKFQITHHGLFC